MEKATSKKKSGTTAKRSASTKRSAPAQKAAPAAPVAVEAAPAAPVPHSVETGERAFVRAIKSDDLIRFRVPEDPFGEVATWERSFNGHIIVLKAGHEYALPRRIVEFIERSLTVQRMSSELTAEFTSEAGKAL